MFLCVTCLSSRVPKHRSEGGVVAFGYSNRVPPSFDKRLCGVLSTIGLAGGYPKLGYSLRAPMQVLPAHLQDLGAVGGQHVSKGVFGIREVRGRARRSGTCTLSRVLRLLSRAVSRSTTSDSAPAGQFRRSDAPSLYCSNFLDNRSAPLSFSLATNSSADSRPVMMVTSDHR